MCVFVSVCECVSVSLYKFVCVRISLFVHRITVNICLFSIFMSVQTTHVPSFLSILKANLSSSVKRSVQSTPVRVRDFRAQYASEASLASVAALALSSFLFACVCVCVCV